MSVRLTNHPQLHFLLLTLSEWFFFLSNFSFLFLYLFPYSFFFSSPFWIFKIFIKECVNCFRLEQNIIITYIFITFTIDILSPWWYWTCQGCKLFYRRSSTVVTPSSKSSSPLSSSWSYHLDDTGHAKVVNCQAEFELELWLQWTWCKCVMVILMIMMMMTRVTMMMVILMTTMMMRIVHLSRLGS